MNEQNNPANLSQHKELEADLALLLQKTLPAIIQSFFERSGERLFSAAEQVENLKYSTLLLDAASNLRANKELLLRTFCSSNQTTNLLISPTSIPTNEIDEESAMSLIDKNDFEDKLNLAAIIRTLESLYGSQLKQIQEKIAYIVDADISRVINPASPEQLCACFHDAIATIEESIQAKRTLYAVFQETLLEFLPDLYAKIENLLISKYGATEKFTASNRRQSRQNKRLSNNLHLQTVLADTTPAPHPENSISTPVPAQPVPVAKESSSVVNTVSNLLHLTREQTPIQQSAVETPATAPEYSAEEISTALAHLQQNATNMENVPDLQQGLLHTLKDTSNSDKQLSQTDKNNLEVYEQLFEALSKDVLLDKEAQSYLERIQIPVMTQAMQNPDFMESDSNPVRNIVNHLSWLDSAIKDNKRVKNTRIRHTLDELMEKITRESSTNPDVFALVEQQLHKITDSVNHSIDHNIKRVTEVYEGQQKLEKARQSVQEEIDLRLAGRKVAKIIVTLLEAGWQHLLVISKLNEHTEDHSFQSNLLIIRNLDAWLSGVEKINQQQAQEALEFIDIQMQSVCTNTFLHHKILGELSTLLLKSGGQPGADIVEMVDIEPPEQTPGNNKDKSQIDEIDQLRVGEWLTFLLDKKIEPLKLVWIGEAPEVIVFVNRNGIKRLELGYEELAELIKTGVANRVESLDVPVMDRATNAMLQKMHEKLIYNATHDPATDLFNRKEYIKRLKRELSRYDDGHHLLCNIEVQDFRIITNACGLSGGDALLKQLADSIKSELPENEIFARLGDKTLSILLKNRLASTAEDLAKELQSKLGSRHFKWQDKSFSIAVSIGVLPLHPDNSYDINSVLQKADSATLAAKSGGRNQIWIYQEDDESLKSQFNLRDWAGRIDQVFSDGRLFLRCQKIVPADPEKDILPHYEILLGIKDENGNVIPPDDFIPGVEHCQRMSEIDRWVVLAVFSWIEQNRSIFETLDGFSINLSGESLNSEKFLGFLKHALSSSKIPLEKITFEITETVAANNVLFVQKFITQIKRFNCKFSLDDFGSGYSSYSYLKSLDVDFLKIDGIFVKDILNSSTDIAIVNSMNEIAHSLGLETIAEYVENNEIQAKLKDIGVDYVQGWGIQKPIILADLA